MLWALGVLGCAAAGASVALAFASDHVSEPGLQAALLVWIILPYILAGLVACWRRPESRFGPLMVAAGFTIFLSTLQWSNEALPYTLGLAFDLMPVVVFLHVFLAFPGGRLERHSERILVAAGYAAALGLQFVKMALGAGGPDNLLAVLAEPRPPTPSRTSSYWRSPRSAWPASVCSPLAAAVPVVRCGAPSSCLSTRSPSAW